MNILKNLKSRNSFFETTLVTINDELVKLFLNKKITYIEMQNLLLRLIKNNKFTKYYNKYPKNINDIYAMADKVKKNLKEYEKNFK